MGCEGVSGGGGQCQTDHKKWTYQNNPIWWRRGLFLFTQGKVGRIEFMRVIFRLFFMQRICMNFIQICYPSALLFQIKQIYGLLPEVRCVLFCRMCPWQPLLWFGGHTMTSVWTGAWKMWRNLSSVVSSLLVSENL